MENLISIKMSELAKQALTIFYHRQIKWDNKQLEDLKNKKNADTLLLENIHENDKIKLQNRRLFSNTILNHIIDNSRSLTNYEIKEINDNFKKERKKLYEHQLTLSLVINKRVIPVGGLGGGILNPGLLVI